MAIYSCNVPRHKSYFKWWRRYLSMYRSRKWKPPGRPMYGWDKMTYHADPARKVEFRVEVLVGRKKVGEMRIQPCHSCTRGFLSSLGITKKFVLQAGMDRLADFSVNYSLFDKIDRQVNILNRMHKVAELAAMEVLKQLKIVVEPPPEPNPPASP